MKTRFKAISWNRNKRIYDIAVGVGVVSYLALFVTIGTLMWSGSVEVLLLRALATCAFVMLHVVLCIGPLARLDRRFLPVLYNRRHLGVATFLVGLSHAVMAIGYYHGFGRLNPLLSLLTSNTNYDSLAAFPFEMLGLLALGILFLLASTSHDFWQKTLAASVWKSLHMLVYPAYLLLVLHVALGALQTETNPLYVVLLGLGFITVVGLHLFTALRERRRDSVTLPNGKPQQEAWIDVGSVDDIAEKRAKTVCPNGKERIAVFRYDGCVSAVSNVCAHQRGPIGEGRISDGCISCPWHGWEYQPHDGQSPPPFHEKIPTYRVRVEGRRILLNPDPLPPGTLVEPAHYEEKTDDRTT